ncbi:MULTISPECIES: PaaI family thioesterase [Mycobacteriaceae]|uniref:PaaI family thioesterase n=1 Tax=Mycobacteriaceae TaxID=1762 RepID=UPI0009DBBD9D|nr:MULTISPECIES: PaaI family thioesterase [Mycobacteriaceae]AXK75216.1 PaaI family thioesterase [Mycolicibacterium neoaurum]
MTTADDTRAGCMVGDPTSVETRFGLHNCHLTTGGNRCAFRIPPWARDRSGRPRVGALMVLADHILGELPYLNRPPRTWTLTGELTLDIISAVPLDGELFAEARTVAGRSETFVECHITDRTGEIVAAGTTRSVTVPAAGADPLADNAARDNAARDDAPIKCGDIDRVLGLSYRQSGDLLHVEMTDPDGWVNGFGIMHGGISACVTELAAAEYVSARNPDLHTAHVHTTYLRPVVVGYPYVATARPYHIGRSSAVVEVLGFGGSGELCTVSTVTARRLGSVDRASALTSTSTDEEAR